MKVAIVLLLLASSLAATGCASNRPTTAQTLALYRAHAGAPVKNFRYFGQINGWTPLGDSAIAVWTRPGEAFLLDISGPCPDIEYSPTILVTNQFDRVTAGFDRVIAVGRNAIQIPCRILKISPLDTRAIRAANRAARDQSKAASGT